MLTALFLPFALQAQLSLPISIDFENATDLNQWTQTDCESSTGISSSYAHGGTHAFAFHWTTTPPQYLISPEFDEATGTEMISFWYANFSSSYNESFEVGFSSTTNNTTAFTWQPSISVPTGTPWTEYTAMVPAGTKYIAIKSTAYDQYYLYIDDIYIGDAPTCFAVTNLAIDGAQTTSSSLTFTWTDVSNSGATYSVYDMSNNTLIEDNITDTTYTVENLNPYTLYAFGVVANCSTTDASTMATVSGRTACGIQTMPWSENFDNWTSKSDCWSFLSGAYNGGNGTPTESTSAWSLNPSYGSYITISGKALTMNLYSTNKYWAVTPTVEITNDDAMLSVDVAVAAWSDPTPNYDDNDTLAFAISTDNGITFTNLRVVTNTELNTLNGEYTTLYVPVTGYNGQNVRFAIYGGSTSGTNPYDNRIAIDNVTVSDPIDCMPVAALTASNIGSYGVTLNWTGNADSYTIYDMSDTTMIETAYETTIVLTTLNPNTQYTFGVTANCGSEESLMRTISFTTLVSCPAPTSLAATLTPGDGTVASLSWTEIGTAEAWQICLNGDTNNLIDVYDNPYEFTDLTPEQAYTAQVRAYCDVDEQSEWSNTITFTPTDAYSITVNDGTTTNGYVPIYGYYTDDITKSQFIIPAANLTAMQLGIINKLTFYSSDANVSWGAATFNVYLTTTNETTISNLADYSNMTQVYAGTLSISNNTMEVNFTTPYLYTGDNLMIGFLQTATGSYSSCSWYGISATGASMGGYGSSINQQNFLPKTTINYIPGDADICFPVTGLTASDITNSSVTLSWSDENNSGATYTIYDMSDSSVVANGISDMEYEISGLTGSTNYTFGVAANCSASEESFIMTINASTDCEGGSCQITIMGEGELNDSWSYNNASISIMQGGRLVGTFSVPNGSTTSSSTYSVCSGIPVSFVWNSTGSYLNECDFTIYDGSNTAVFTGNGENVTGTFFTMNDACPTCIAPTITVTDVTENSVTISWTGDADSYDVYNGNDFETNVTTNTYTFNGLTAGTGYTFGVQAICSADDSSAINTITIMTNCEDVTTLPYYEGFESGLGCWTTINASNDGQPWSVNNCASLSNTNPHGGGYVASSWSWSGSAMHANAWLISPRFVLPNTSDSLTFSWWENTSPSYKDHYSVVLSTTTNDTASFTTVIRPYDTSAGVWTLQTVDLTPYAGQSIYIAFHHVDYDMNYLLIDDISLFQGGYVPPAPDTLTVTFEVDDATMGTTVPAPGTYQYITGDTIHFGSQANPGYHFLKWEITLGGQTQEYGPQYANGYYVLANSWMQYQNVVFKAFFEAGNPDSTTITYAVNDANMGTIIPAPGTYTIYVGDNITATATPNADYVMSAWVLNIYSGSSLLDSDTIYSDDADFNNPMNFGTLPQNFADNDYTITIIAVFESSTTPVTTYTVTLNSADATMGTVSPAGASTVNEGSSFTANATAADGYHFVAWMNGTTQVSTANPYTFTVTGDITLTATFEANDPAVTYYNVTVSSANTTMGNVTSTASGQVAENTEVTVTATANPGYIFVNWTNAEGTEVSTNNEYTFTVTADVTLIANFEIEDGINSINASNILIYAANSMITVRGAEGNDIYVYDMNGRCIYQNANANETETINMASAGIYLVRVSNVLIKKVVVVK